MLQNRLSDTVWLVHSALASVGKLIDVFSASSCPAKPSRTARNVFA